VVEIATSILKTKVINAIAFNQVNMVCIIILLLHYAIAVATATAKSPQTLLSLCFCIVASSRL